MNLLVSALALFVSAAPAVPSVTLEKRETALADGTKVPFEMGVLTVRENRAKPTSRTIQIAFARIKALTPKPVAPIVYLPGGPGTSLLDAFTGDSPNSKVRLTNFRRYAAVADVIVFDQRGFSITKLTAPKFAKAPLDKPLTVEAETESWKRFAKEAIAANPEADFSGYDMLACVDDVDELRQALGYKKLNLLGTSFGAQQSFAIIKVKPEIVERVVLSGVEPLHMALDRPSWLYATMQRIALDADRAPALQPYLPKGGVMEALRLTRDRFTKEGPVTVKVGDEQVVLGLEDFQTAILPGDGAEAWPAMVLSIFHGHYEAWAKAEIEARKEAPWSTVINPLIDSSINISKHRLAVFQNDPATAFLGRWEYFPQTESRDAWPTREIPDSLRDPTVSQVPVLFVSGDYDSSTPLENALEILPFFPNGRLLISHHGEHGQVAYLTQAYSDPKTFGAVLEFYNTGSTKNLPTEVTLPMPNFAVPRGLAPNWPVPAVDRVVR